MKLALEAGAGILAHREEGQNFRLKNDSSPVTEADIWADQFIYNGIRRLDENAIILSEEGTEVDSSETFWLVDGLDGTKEFIRGSDEFTVNIALIENKAPILGIVYAPALGVAYMGGKSLPSVKIINGKAEAIMARELADPVSIVTSRSHVNQETRDFCGQFAGAKLFPSGSSLKFCLVAEGIADLYPRMGRTMEWDTAAGHAVLKAAGGHVFESKTHRELTYAKAGKDNPNFIAVGDRRALDNVHRF